MEAPYTAIAVQRRQRAVREAATICPTPCKLTFDLLTLKVVSESRVTWATSVPILVFLGVSVLDLGPVYATDRRQTDVRHRLMPPTLRAGHNNAMFNSNPQNHASTNYSHPALLSGRFVAEYYSPDFVVNLTEVRTVRRPQVWMFMRVTTISYIIALSE